MTAFLILLPIALIGFSASHMMPVSRLMISQFHLNFLHSIWFLSSLLTQKAINIMLLTSPVFDTTFLPRKSPFRLLSYF